MVSDIIHVGHVYMFVALVSPVPRANPCEQANEPDAQRR